MRPLFLPLLCLGLAIPVTASACGSLVTSVCVQEIEQAPARKVLRVKPSVTAFVVGDRFPFESRSFVMDPARYNLKPTDGTWRYYAMDGVVYRIDLATGEVLEVIRTRRTAHLR